MGLQALNMQFFLKFRFVPWGAKQEAFLRMTDLQQTFFLESKISDIVQKANFLMENTSFVSLSYVKNFESQTSVVWEM